MEQMIITKENQTSVTEFILVGFSNHPELQAPLFIIFLLVYTITLTGNILIILITTIDSALQSPMYFFLRNLSSLEICFNLVIVPKMLVNFLTENKTISYAGCATQMYFFFFFGAAECCLLAAMAYDRYIAICNPLRYPDIMNRRACFHLAGISWFSGFPVSTVQTTWIFSLPFCGPNRVNHFFCDSPPVLELACADTYMFEIEALTATVLFIMFPFLLILLTYIRIITTILRMPSAEGRHKAFSTCSSHLVVVTLFYGTATSTYFRPKSTYSPDMKKILSLSYTVITPMLNPIIYSLRNKEVKGALRRTLGRRIFSYKK
ncbi:olfactory receptor 10A4-like isoform X2 [Eublepharis macularius]|uniref:Olfactory receptor n=1 Tax=Eublepharis macularius TaxID=481883 RepID=A0AA97K113_EUBMA|nr:olfactory receptor 10A4-like isoform X2 [Eublepharis macularius]